MLGREKGERRLPLRRNGVFLKLEGEIRSTKKEGEEDQHIA